MTTLLPRASNRSVPFAVRLALAALALVPAVARSQWPLGVDQADSLLAAGRVATAESVYYATSSARPRDARARAALGRYLASRGALRIGAVLLEEARLFGADSAGIARSLAPIYGSLGDYRALSVLPASPLTSAEQARARWLVSHPPVLEFPDSVSKLGYKPLTDGSGLGTIKISIDDRLVDAAIDPSVSGVVLQGKAARRRGGIRLFGADSTGIVGVISELHLGDVILSNVPARLDTSSAGASTSKARGVLLGLDVLRRLAPTFEPKADTVTLRRSGQISPTTPGARAPMLLDERGLRVLIDARWDSASSRTVAQLLAMRSWTLDAKRGSIVLQ
ncbi:MAG TPA: hypothetical protein VGD02_00930 [Gemmatimonadaceae bacterium]